MQFNSQKSNTRLKWIILFQIILLILLISRLYYLQVIKYDFFLNLSNLNQSKIDKIVSKRANFFDRNNIQLTDNVQYFFSINDNKSYNFDQLEKEISSNIDLKMDYIEYYNRYYIYANLFSHIIGYVKLNNEKIMYGFSGLEKSLNSSLESYYNTLVYKSEKDNNQNSQVYNVKSGQDIKLTIDLKLQEFITNRMSLIPGAVVVMNVKTGEILSMVSSPTFNPNDFVDIISEDEWKDIVNNPYKPLINKCISAKYPPGSVFKLITAITALKNGWKVNNTIDCKGQIKIGQKRIFHCWKLDGHGPMNITDAIMHSCNIFFAELVKLINIEDIYETAKDFGITEQFDLELPNIVSGNLPTRSWKKKTFHQYWSYGDTVNTSIGQGFVLTTPLELAVMVSRIANGGYKIKPYILSDSKIREYNENLFYSKQRFIDAKIINIIKKGMYKAVNEKHGTVFLHRIYNYKYKMAGKTGTAQLISKDKEINSKLLNHHGLFVGYAPYNNPKYAISVIVENGLSGANSAAPIARDILLYAQENHI